MLMDGHSDDASWCLSMVGDASLAGGLLLSVLVAVGEVGCGEMNSVSLLEMLCTEDFFFITCLFSELGIGIVAYSPLGRGFFSSGQKLAENFTHDDFRQYLPRFQPENLEHNKTIFERVNEMATKKGCTPSQLALAWVHHQGNDVCPIPGTTKIKNFDQNIGALSVKLTPEEMAELESFASDDAVKGDRYGSGIATWKESDTPPLSSWKAA